MYQHVEFLYWMKNQTTHAILPAQENIDLINVCNQDCFYRNSAEHWQASPVQKHYTQYIELLDKLASLKNKKEHASKNF